MSHSAEISVDHGHHEEYTSTGLPHKKICMWAFLGSDCIFFGTLISTHLIYRKTATEPLEDVLPQVVHNGQLVDVTIQQLLDIPLTSFSTFILLASSLLMALAVSSMHKANLKTTRWMLLGVIVFGLIFLGCQVLEFTHFVRHYGLTLNSHIFGSTFFVLTGTHGVHVTLGILWLIGWLIYSFTGKMGPEHAMDVEVAGLYWHFVDIVWVIIFPVVYLTEYIL